MNTAKPLQLSACLVAACLFGKMAAHTVMVVFLVWGLYFRKGVKMLHKAHAIIKPGEVLVGVNSYMLLN